MSEFIAQYWLTFVFGAIIAVVSFFCKKFWKMYSAELNNNKAKEHEEILSTIRSDLETHYASLNASLQEVKDETDKLKKGLLSVQGKEFKAYCRMLLQDDHDITLIEYELLEKDHDAYKSLGGNSEGDHLYDLAKKKAESALTKPEN